jgi:hypothetical protein
METMNTKRCYACRETKPLTEFYRVARIPGKTRTDCKKCAKASSTEWVKQNPGRHKNHLTLSRYGLTPFQLQAMILAQAGQCAICKAVFQNDNYKIDHDHGTAEVRGLLCHHCNAGLGLFRDSPLALRSAANYLDNFRVTRPCVDIAGNLLSANTPTDRTATQ